MHWEDIIKEKLDSYQSPIPEGSRERFQARRANATGSGKRHPVFWAVAAATAVAATLSIVFIPNEQDGNDPINNGTEAIATAEGVFPIPSPADTEVDAAQAFVQPRHTAAPQRHTQPQSDEQSQMQQPQEQQLAQPQQQQEQADHEQGATQPQVTHSEAPKQDVAAGDASSNVKIGKIIETGFLGGSAVALATVLCVTNGFGIGAAGGPIYDTPYSSSTPKEASHHLSPNFGVTINFPVSERWHFVTGAEYELDHSIDQYAHFLCIPMRMDWRVASIKRLDFYLGAGIAGNFCLAATRNGTNMQQLDAPFVSLQGVGGLQYHITNTLGVYVEPRTNWSILSSDNIIKTDPWSFAISTGLRININQNQ